MNKTAQEWEQEFDLLYNGINSNLAPALDKYEKSVFLTMAQEQIVKTLYSGGSLGSESFEQTELLRRSLDALVKEKSYSSTSDGTDSTFGKEYILNDDVMYITYEQLTYSTDKCSNMTMLVVPVTQDEFHKTRKNPFRGANARRALRLDSGKDSLTGNDKVEIVSTIPTYTYTMRYLKKPYPIILETLTSESGDTINGETAPHNPICELDDSLFRVILTTAVQLALTAVHN